jgi:glyoxylase-like metal-dependent hydrolase (beta-lactamase superfamily II)
MDRFQFKIENKDILVYRSIFAPVKSNMFVLLTGKEAVVFDPNENEEVLQLFKEKGIEKVHILQTHEHYDHTSGVNWLKDHTGADVYCQRNCAEVISTKRGNNPALVALVLADQDKKEGGNRYKEFRDKFEPYTIVVDKTFGKEDKFNIGEFEFSVTSTPGHCPGAACYKLFDKMVFTGDTLLQHDPVILSFRESVKDDYEKIALPYLQSLAKDTIIMPGHGDPFVLKDTYNI